jgi:hypothetical protein
MKTKPDFVQNFVRDLPRDEYPYFAEHVDQHMTESVRASGKSEFEFGLDLILDSLDGMRSKAIRRSRRPKRKGH